MWPVFLENRFYFCFCMGSGTFDWSTLEKIEMHHSEDKEEKWWILEILLSMRKTAHVPNAEPKNITAVAWWRMPGLQSIKKVMSITKNMQATEVFASIWLVCGNGHILITTLQGEESISCNRDGYIWVQLDETSQNVYNVMRTDWRFSNR